MTIGSHDSKHNEDVKIEIQESPPSPLLEGSAEEKALVRKLDKRIMPIACALYLFSCLSFFSLRVVIYLDYVLRFGSQ